MKIYNTLKKQKEDFIPLEPGKVKMYACGITVYDQCHIGHARQAIAYDMITKYLRFKGLEVKYVRNYTDVDDKIIARANDLGVNALDYSADRIIDAEADLKALDIADATVKPQASQYIPQIQKFVEGLINKGNAYATDNGDVYFSVDSFPQYGELSGIKSDELIEGTRKDIEPGKRSPKDFALWKSAKPGEISWESPWGEGRPGWHIECSAMAIDNLGETIDIHGGGQDLVFPHHENEKAQSEALTGKTFVKTWTHSGLITVDGQKMGKSLGNSVTIKQALNAYDKEVIRYAMLSKHYSSPVDYNDKEFSLAEKHLYYFYNSLKSVKDYLAKADATNAPTTKEMMDINKKVSQIRENFINAMDDDFNSASALSQLFATFKNVNSVLNSKGVSEEYKAEFFKQFNSTVLELYKVFGVLQYQPEQFIDQTREKYMKGLDITVPEIQQSIAERATAKENKDYAKSDEIRNNLDARGIILKDTRAGTTWDIKELYIRDLAALEKNAEQAKEVKPISGTIKFNR
ncbi:MAG: cysteine--tRNA ligase [Clostridiales bacterium]|nr:cysteine--tRNA ligase [Clostridiales bacterium]